MGEGSKFSGLFGRFRYSGDESNDGIECGESLEGVYEFSSGYKVIVDREGVRIFWDGVIVLEFPVSSVKYLNYNIVVIGVASPDVYVVIDDSGLRYLFGRYRSLFYGIMCGDGGIYARDYVLNASLDYPELVKLFSYLIRRLYDVNTHVYYIEKEHYYFVKCYSKKAFLDYIKYPHRVSSHNWKVPFEYLDKDTFRLFLRGLLSTDGNVLRIDGGRYIRIRIFSVNREELQNIRKYLREVYGIKSSVYKNRIRDPKDHVYVPQIEKIQAIKFLAFIGTSYKPFHNRIVKKYFRENPDKKNLYIKFRKKADLFFAQKWYFKI